jgi:Na+/proline symporter
MLGAVVLIIYAVLMLTATLIFTKQAQSKESFHVADRNIGTGIAALSIAATWIWAPSLFTSAEKAYVNGIPGIFWFLVPNILCLIIFIPFAKRIRQKCPYGITLTGYMTDVYQSAKVKGVYTFQLGALAVLSTAVQLLAGGKLLATVLGIPLWVVTVILAAIAYAYARFSGLKASVITDVIQLGIILIGCGLLVPWTVSKAGGGSTVIKGLYAISGGYDSLFSKSGLEVFLGFGLPTAIGLLSGPFGDQCFWQRAFAIRKNSIGRAFLGGALIFGLVPLSLSMIGFAAAGSGFIAVDPSMVNMEFILAKLPSWTMAPFLMMILSGLLSTVDSNLCAAASMTTDWQITGKLGNSNNIKASRRVMLILLGVSILIANIPGLTVTHLFLFYGTLRASTLFPTVLTLLDKKLSAQGVFAGIVASLCVGLPVFAIGNIWNMPIWKTAGSLITVLLSGIVALLLSRKGAKA